jgi:hypothetical protein
MINTSRVGWLAVLGVMAFESSARAQIGQPRPVSSPAYSPYLNLARPGNAANNYYGLVRPQIDFQNQVNTLQQQYGVLSRDVNAPAADQVLPPPTTGHAAQFMNYSRYYPGFAANRTGRAPTQPTTPPSGRR